MPNIERTTRTILAKVLQTSEIKIVVSTSRKNLPTWDSLAHMNIMLALEEEFEIEFSDQEIANSGSLQLLLNILYSKIR